MTDEQIRAATDHKLYERLRLMFLDKTDPVCRREGVAILEELKRRLLQSER